MGAWILGQPREDGAPKVSRQRAECGYAKAKVQDLLAAVRAKIFMVMGMAKGKEALIRMVGKEVGKAKVQQKEDGKAMPRKEPTAGALKVPTAMARKAPTAMGRKALAAMERKEAMALAGKEPGEARDLEDPMAAKASKVAR